MNQYKLFLIIILMGSCISFSASGQDTQSDISPSWTKETMITDLGRITNAMNGQNVKIRARVADFKPPWNEKAPNTITITDGAKSLPVVYWSDVAPDIPLECLMKGAFLEIGGQIRDYNGAIQIKLSGKRDCYVKIVNPSETTPETKDTSDLYGEKAQDSYGATLLQSRVPINSVSKDNLRRIFTIAGLVTDYRAPWSERAPHKITLNDGTGTMIVVYWAEVANNLSNTPKTGDQIQVTGESQDFRGELQVNVRSADAIRFLGANDLNQTPLKPAQPPSPAPANQVDEKPPVVTRGQHSPSTTWHRSYDSAMKQAGAQGKPMIVYFRKEGFPKCLEVETSILMSNEFNNLAQNFTCMFEDLSQGPLLAYHYGVHRIPHIEILDRNGDRIARFSFEIPFNSLLQAMQTGISSVAGETK